MGKHVQISTPLLKRDYYDAADLLRWCARRPGMPWTHVQKQFIQKLARRFKTRAKRMG